MEAKGLDKKPDTINAKKLHKSIAKVEGENHGSKLKEPKVNENAHEKECKSCENPMTAIKEHKVLHPSKFKNKGVYKDGVWWVPNTPSWTKKQNYMKSQVVNHKEREEYAQDLDKKEFKILPKLTSKAPIPPNQHRLSGAFNDYNKVLRKHRNQPRVSKFQDWNTWGGNEARGKYPHKHTESKELNIKFKRAGDPPPKELDPVQVELQQQADTMGTEVRGYRKLLLAKARADIKKDERKIAKGDLHKRGWWGSGNRGKNFEKVRIKDDRAWMRVATEDDEFAELSKKIAQEKNKFSQTIKNAVSKQQEDRYLKIDDQGLVILDTEKLAKASTDIV